jgi:hypothetical protein
VALRRQALPPAIGDLLAWVRTHAHAGTVAGLARTYLRPRDARAIERLLRAGQHGQAADRYCQRFSERCFPLEYPWTRRADGRLLIEVAAGIQHEGYADSWEEYADLWSLKPVFQLSWALMEDPYGDLRDEFLLDEYPDEEASSADRLCDQAREAIAHVAGIPADGLFADVPADGFPYAHLRDRFTGTRWEPLLWAAPWLWRLSGNPFLDQSNEDMADPVPWADSQVFRLAAAYREAVRMMDAVQAFDAWLCQAPTERAAAAVRAALGPPSDRISTILDLPILDKRAGGSASCGAPAP